VVNSLHLIHLSSTQTYFHNGQIKLHVFTAEYEQSDSVRLYYSPQLHI